MKYIILILLLISTTATAGELDYRPLAGQEPSQISDYRTRLIIQQQQEQEVLRQIRLMQLRAQYQNYQPRYQPSQGADHTILRRANID